MTNGEALDSIDSASSARVGPSSSRKSVSGDVVIVESPAELAAAAGLDVDVYSTARMVASEMGSGTAAELLALAEAVRNHAARRGVSITSALTVSSKPGAGGLYGEQAAGHWASTRLDPNGRHVAAAVAALQGTSYARGAVDFFDPATQDGGVQGTHVLKQSSSTYITNNATKNKLEWIGPLAGVDARRLMLFSPASGAIDVTAALDAAAGRGGPVVSDSDDEGPSGSGGAGAVLAGLALAVGAWLWLKR